MASVQRLPCMGFRHQHSCLQSAQPFDSMSCPLTSLSQRVPACVSVADSFWVLSSISDSVLSDSCMYIGWLVWLDAFFCVQQILEIIIGN